MVVFIYRPEYYNQSVDEGGASLVGHAEISIAKHRNGALKDVPLRFISKYAKFTDPEPGDFDISGALAPNGKFENGINTLTVQSKMNDMDEDHEPPY
jgi:replicative DNA helicase